jgi:hypothetical protein
MAGPAKTSRLPLGIFVSSLGLLAAVGVAGWFYLWRPSAKTAQLQDRTPQTGATPVPAGPGTTTEPVPTPLPVTPTAVPAIVQSPSPTPAPAVVVIREVAGRAFFRSNVYASITLDEKKKGGVSPSGIKVEGISPGRHRAVFTVQDYMSIEKEFEIKAGQSTDVLAEFPARGLLQIAVPSEASGAEVLVDGKVVGAAPLKKTIASGPHLIEVRREGFEPSSREVVVPEDDAVKVTFELKRK